MCIHIHVHTWMPLYAFWYDFIHIDILYMYVQMLGNSKGEGG